MSERYGDYELTRLIATGGMAEIYLAEQSGGVEGFTRHVVVKRMLPQLAVRPDFVQMFLDEGRLAGNINHPNIVQVLNLGEVEHSYYIAMEFVDGPHLGSLFAHSLRLRKPLPIEQCVYIIARAADGLHYAHELHDPSTGQHLNIVHRDISPQNVLVSRQGDVKITDFGVAKASTHQTKTRTGIIKGKVAYMSPEQCLGEVVDRRTDVFALGVVLYELLTRRRLFRDKSDLLIMQKITGEDVVPPSTINRELDSDLDEICAKALARDKHQRYADASELSEALDIWLIAKGFGDIKTQLHRWFEENALELSIGSSGTISSPGISAPTPRAAGPGEQTAATPSLNSAETVMRPPPRSGGFSGLSSLPDRSSPNVEATQRMANQRGAPIERVDTEESDGDTARNLARNTFSSDAMPGDSETMQVPLDMAPQLLGPAGRIDDPTSSPRVRQRSMPVAAAIGGGIALALAVVAAVVVATSSNESTERGGGETGTLVVDSGVAGTDEPQVDKAQPIDPPSGSSVAKIRIETVPPGINVLVDDEKLVKSPAEIERAAGPIKLQAQFRDQAPVEESLELKGGEARVIRLLAKVPLIVKTKPAKAEVRVGEGRETVLEGETPLDKKAVLAPEKPQRIRITLEGHKPIDKMVTPQPGEAVIIDETLQPVVFLGGGGGNNEKKLKPGILNMRSSPWVNVKVSSTGEKLGATTFTGQKVPAGKQTLLLTNPEQGINESLTVTIPEDKAVNVNLEFEKKGSRWVLKTKNIR